MLRPVITRHIAPCERAVTLTDQVMTAVSRPQYDVICQVQRVRNAMALWGFGLLGPKCISQLVICKKRSHLHSCCFTGDKPQSHKQKADMATSVVMVRPALETRHCSDSNAILTQSSSLLTLQAQTAPRLQHQYTTATGKIYSVSTLWHPARYSSIFTQMFGKSKVPLHCAVYHYSSGRSGSSVEKKLIQLMDMWEVEDAVSLLRQSVEASEMPHPNIILNLQQQLANLGEVECLLELHDFLKEHKLTTDDKFFHCLQEAYYNSGRIAEGVAVLRLLYHRTRKFSDVDIYFTLLTVMVLRHFPDHIGLIISFVTDLKDAQMPVLEAEACLWKCYVMVEQWMEADNLLLSNEELRLLLPKQVARICQAADKVEFNKIAVFSWLLSLLFIRQKLRVMVAETLIVELVSQKKWHKLLQFLKQFKSSNLPVHVNKLSIAVDSLQQNLSPQYDADIQKIRQWCDDLKGDKV